MKGERKRKRAAGKKADDRMKTRERESAAAVIPSPTEEEVDEFFSILRRMRLAANYFHKGNFNSTKDGASNGRHQDPTISVDGSKAGAGSGLDLNAVPEAEINSL
ncbi:hypothetical protein ABFX02_09G049700 [Erythranthe guttata]